jgi:hypothetical protein
MPASAQRSPETIIAYERETGRLVAQYQRENPDDVLRAPLVQTARWDRGTFAILFDAANPDASEEKRNVSTVAPQALFLLNHDFVHIQARQLAERLAASATGRTRSSKLRGPKAKVVAHQQKVAQEEKKRNRVPILSEPGADLSFPFRRG